MEGAAVVALLLLKKSDAVVELEQQQKLEHFSTQLATSGNKKIESFLFLNFFRKP